MLLPQGTPHLTVHILLTKSCTCSIIILYFYSYYCWFLQQNGFAFPVSMENMYPRIMRSESSLQKKPQYFFTIVINCYFITSVTIIFNFMFLCSSFLCSSSSNVINFIQFLYSYVCLGLYTNSLYCLKSDTLLYLSFA